MRPHSTVLLSPAKLASLIRNVIERKQLTQTGAGALMGVDQL